MIWLVVIELVAPVSQHKYFPNTETTITVYQGSFEVGLNPLFYLAPESGFRLCFIDPVSPKSTPVVYGHVESFNIDFNEPGNSHVSLSLTGENIWLKPDVIEDGVLYFSTPYPTNLLG